MADKDYSRYQQKVINNYYRQRDVIMLQKLQELVTELYLAKDTPREDRLWERVEKAMANLKINAQIAQHILQKRDVKVLARNVEDWQKSPGRK